MLQIRYPVYMDVELLFQTMTFSSLKKLSDSQEIVLNLDRPKSELLIFEFTGNFYFSNSYYCLKVKFEKYITMQLKNL